MMKPQNPLTQEDTTMKMTYRTENGCLLPDLAAPEEPTVTGKYAMLRETFLQEQKPHRYLNLLTSGTLNQHLLEIQETAETMLEELMPRLQKEAGVTEELKAQNQMEWVGRMNNLRHSAEAVILTSLVYA
jgi:hypothetical protein